ncbi:MAG TPA: hypothetical protein VEY07_07485 [Thermoplasmata archaeon]|nr:hypothetical protein [Thermoplasmata archaeon]
MDERPRPVDRRGDERADEETGARRQRAREEPLDFSILETDPGLVLRVRNPLHGTSYRVYRPTYPEPGPSLCTCPDFGRRGLGTCKHLEGATRWLAEHPVVERKARAAPVADGELWQRVIRRMQGREGRRDGRSLRAVGAVLYELEG